MPLFRIGSLGELSRQFQFTPAELRAVQLANAEDLLLGIDPAKAYPLDFVIFRITGYHPKSTVAEELLTGLALQHDLGLLIEQVSQTLDTPTQSLAEPVLSIDDVAERFNVTSKTIQRWRRKGLPARRFVFPDGKRRVGFLLRNVERFVNNHQDQVARGGNFSQVGEEEREEILRWARRLGGRCRCCRNEIARRIAKHLQRSPLTVLHTIKKHDAEHPDQAIFPLAATELSAEERRIILKGHRRGLGLKSLSRRVCRPRATVYRVLMDERVARLSKKTVKFIDDPLYHAPDAAQTMQALAAPSALAEPLSAEQLRVPRDLPPYLADLYRTPLLGKSRERALFLKFNFHKFQFVAARRRLDPQFARSADLQRLEGHLREAQDVKNKIVQANLRLVVSVAKRHLRPGLNLMELVSDGNLTLMRAVEGFDVHRGNRFSTYATFALMKGFARSVPAMQAAREGLGGDHRLLQQVPDARGGVFSKRFADQDNVRHLLSHLSERERRVVSAHYGVGEGVHEGEELDAPVTYEQLGRRLGLSKQRVRQIERSALAKLRAAADSMVN
jgi:RNA polymerase primary sigma factor